MSEADIVTRLYQAVSSADAASAALFLAPDATLHVPGTHTSAGDHVGAEAILRFLTDSAAEAGTRTDVLDVLTGRDHVAVYCRVRAERGTATLDNHTVHLLHLDAGRVTDIWFHNRDQAAVDAFWPAETDVSVVGTDTDDRGVGLGEPMTGAA